MCFGLLFSELRADIRDDKTFLMFGSIRTTPCSHHEDRDSTRTDICDNKTFLLFGLVRITLRSYHEKRDPART